MTKNIIISVALGILMGYFFIPESFVVISETILVIGLSIMLLLVGIELGIEGTVVPNFKKVGIRVLVFPFVIIIGTLIGVAISSLFISITLKESLMVASGFGWYTMAPIMIASVSEELGAISFMHNVIREVLGIILVPIVAKKIGHVETTALPGAAAMDVALPIIEKSTSPNIAVYSFVVGVVLSTAVPILVQFFINI